MYLNIHFALHPRAQIEGRQSNYSQSEYTKGYQEECEYTKANESGCLGKSQSKEAKLSCMYFRGNVKASRNVEISLVFRVVMFPLRYHKYLEL